MCGEEEEVCTGQLGWISGRDGLMVLVRVGYRTTL